MAYKEISISEVLLLFGITSNKKEVLITCPFCGTKKKMGVNTNKNLFNCPKCETNGNAVGLYSLLKFNEEYKIQNQERKKEIFKSLMDDLGQNQIIPANKRYNLNNKPSYEEEKYNFLNIIKVYNMFFKQLYLLDKHKQNLLNRGLNEKHIKYFGYKSMPEHKDIPRILSNIINAGLSLDGVPGFYYDERKKKYSLNRIGNGILIPIRNSNRDIISVQIRLDVPFENGTKYLYFSSTDKPNGKKALAYVHLVRSNITPTMYLTEGVLKSDIAYSLNFNNCIEEKVNIMALPGVSATSHFKPFLKKAKKRGLKKIIVAFDSDKYENNNVLNAESKVIEMAEELGIDAISISWNRNYKGMDDFALYKLTKQNK